MLGFQAATPLLFGGGFAILLGLSMILAPNSWWEMGENAYSRHYRRRGFTVTSKPKGWDQRARIQGILIMIVGIVLLVIGISGLINYRSPGT